MSRQIPPQLVRKDHERTNARPYGARRTGLAVEAQTARSALPVAISSGPGSYSRQTDDLDMLANRNRIRGEGWLHVHEQDVDSGSLSYRRDEGFRRAWAAGSISSPCVLITCAARASNGRSYPKPSSPVRGQLLVLPQHDHDVVTQGVALIHRSFPDGEDPQSCLFETISVCSCKPKAQLQNRPQPSRSSTTIGESSTGARSSTRISPTWSKWQPGGRSPSFAGHNLNTKQEMMLYFAA